MYNVQSMTNVLPDSVLDTSKTTPSIYSRIFNYPSSMIQCEDDDETISKSASQKVEGVSKPLTHKDKITGAYENRLRRHAAPEKLFEYFASVHNGVTGEHAMTPRDVVRALTPYSPALPGAVVGSNNEHFQFNARHIRTHTETKERYKSLLKKALYQKDQEALQTAWQMRQNAELHSNSIPPTSATTKNSNDMVTLSTHATVVTELDISLSQLKSQLQSLYGNQVPDFIDPLHSAASDNGHSLLRLLDQDDDGLIDYGEFILLLTVLAVPLTRLQTAFRMYDENGDGTLDLAEFKRLMDTVRNETPLGRQVRDKKLTGASLGHLEAATARWSLFMTDHEGKILPDKFYSYINAIHDAIHWHEFCLYDNGLKGYLTLTEFGQLVVAYAPVESQQILLGRLNRFKTSNKDTRISFEHVKLFHALLQRIDLLERSLKLTNELTGSETFDRKQLLRAVHASVAALRTQDPNFQMTIQKNQSNNSVENLSPGQIDVIVALFDADGDQKLTVQELLGILQTRSEGMLAAPRRGDKLKSMFHRIKKCYREHLAA